MCCATTRARYTALAMSAIDAAAAATGDTVWKILLVSEAESLPATGWAGTTMDQDDGFIHLSCAPQVLGTLDRFYAPPVRHVVLCAVRVSWLRSSQAAELKYEAAPDGAGPFPHLYAVRLPLPPQTLRPLAEIFRPADGCRALQTLDPKTQIDCFWLLERRGPDQAWSWDGKIPFEGLPSW